jgi:hypothetical protein
MRDYGRCLLRRLEDDGQVERGFVYWIRFFSREFIKAMVVIILTFECESITAL